jgi:hypothetical protein
MLLILSIKYVNERAYYVNVNKISRQFHSASTGIAILSIRITNKLQVLWHLDVSIPGPLAEAGGRTLLFVGAFANMRKATISVIVFLCLSIRPHGNNSAPNARIFMEFDI